MRFVAVACCLIAGCTTMSETACRGSNWYEVGENDARMGRQPQLELYARQCSPYQIQPSGQDYLAGWSIGTSKASFRQPN
jgi:hypothetical protein